MAHYIYTNILGSFVFDSDCHLLDMGSGDDLRKKYGDLAEPGNAMILKMLKELDNARFFQAFRLNNLDFTRQRIKDSVLKDVLLVHAVDSIRELDRVASGLVKRLRDWFVLCNPELVHAIGDNERFVLAVLEDSVTPEGSAGADIDRSDLDRIIGLASLVKDVYRERKVMEDYLGQVMEKLCPNVHAIAGSLVGAKLLAQAGSLKHLSEMPASTVQILGAEKALFRHMKTGARPPKYGILFQHHLVQKAGKSAQGRAARLLADKISIAAKVDYFKGAFIGDKLMEDIKRKLL
jgi:nucleolar protein 56